MAIRQFSSRCLGFSSRMIQSCSEFDKLFKTTGWVVRLWQIVQNDRMSRSALTNCSKRPDESIGFDKLFKTAGWVDRLWQIVQNDRMSRSASTNCSKRPDESIGFDKLFKTTGWVVRLWKIVQTDRMSWSASTNCSKRPDESFGFFRQAKLWHFFRWQVCIWLVPFGPAAVPHGKALFAFTDISSPTLKLQSTNDGYNILLRSLDVSMKVLESLTVNCKDLFAKAKAAGDSVLISAAAFLPRLECTMLLDAPAVGSPMSSERPLSSSETASLRPSSAENILSSTPRSSTGTPTQRGKEMGFHDSSASLRDDFGEFVPREADMETMSLRSVMSESSVGDMSFGLDELAAVLPTVQGVDEAVTYAPVDVPMGPNWTARSPASSERGVVRRMFFRKKKSRSFFYSYKSGEPVLMFFTEISISLFFSGPVLQVKPSSARGLELLNSSKMNKFQLKTWLCSGLGRCAPVCAGVLRFVPGCSGLCRCAPVCAGVLRFVAGYSGLCQGASVCGGVLRFVPVCSGLCRGAPVCGGVLRFGPGCSGLCRGAPVCGGVLRFGPGCSGLCRGAPVCGGVLRFVAVCSGLCRGAPVCAGVLRFVAVSTFSRNFLSSFSCAFSLWLFSLKLGKTLELKIFNWIKWRFFDVRFGKKFKKTRLIKSRIKVTVQTWMNWSWVFFQG